jgi:hypothetical protein
MHVTWTGQYAEATIIGSVSLPENLHLPCLRNVHVGPLGHTCAKTHGDAGHSLSGDVVSR